MFLGKKTQMASIKLFVFLKEVAMKKINKGTKDRPHSMSTLKDRGVWREKKDENRDISIKKEHMGRGERACSLACSLTIFYASDISLYFFKSYLVSLVNS
jgi:hypothetical protein